jgi:uncharacterized protein (TIGR03435 family)
VKNGTSRHAIASKYNMEEHRMPHTLKYLACLAIAAPIWAQSAEFEVASVKQLDQSVRPGQQDLSFLGKSGKLMKITGNRVTLTGTLRTFIVAAYGIKDYQLSAPQPWAGSLIFEVTAKTPGDDVPTEEQVRPMLQALLTDRFQLKIRRETKELPVFHLTRTKKALGLKPAGVDEKFDWRLTQEPGGTLRSKATKESIGDFVQLVGVSSDRPVIDKTGVTGDIDYDILITQPEGKSQDDVNHAIVDAVTEQLGLKLESAKDPIEMLIVERVEKPSEN